MVINWSGLDDKEKHQLMPTLLTTENWILLTQPLGESNKPQTRFHEAKLVARTHVENSRHKGWWREKKRRTSHTLHDNSSVDEHKRLDSGSYTHNHPGSLRSRELERHPLLRNGRPRKNT